MKELLERWAELDPEWCRYEPGHKDKIFYVNGIAVSESPLGYGNDDIRVFCIQGATQQAIEARGWLWSNMRQRVGSKYLASVRGRLGWSEKSPAKALLTAYLNALEAQGVAG